MQHVSVPLYVMLIVFCWAPLLPAEPPPTESSSFQQAVTASSFTALAAWVAVATFFWRVLQDGRLERRRRQELVSAVYHHIEKAIEYLSDEEVPKINEAIQAEIAKDSAYTPHIVRSADADLTYDHIIGVMEWLDDEGERAVANYFYTQSILNDIAASFGLEYVQGWPTERKLRLWKLYIGQQAETLAAAQYARTKLEEARTKN